MALLSIKNLTIGVYGFNDEYSGIKNNQAIGILGKIIDNLLIKSKNQRYSILKLANYIRDNVAPSEKNQTLSYLISHNIIDVHSLPLNYNYMDSDECMERSSIVNTEFYNLGHFISESKKSESIDLTYSLFHNEFLLIIIAIGYLLVILINYIIIKFINYEKINSINKPTSLEAIKQEIKLKNSSKKINIRFLDLLFLNYRKSFEISLIILFYNLFMFFILSILTNSIKTDKVIINTDDFLDSDKKLMKTTRSLAMDSDDDKWIDECSKNNILFKLYYKKIKENKFIKVDYNQFKKLETELKNWTNNLTKFFLVGKRDSIIAFIRYF